VDGVQAFGCFVDVLPGKGGLVHVRCPLDCVSSWDKHADWQ
jgi:predicted RNA-binding protein with RPS1 domain